ncbi:MAG TPA: NADH-quinone oxidoreductase subunit C [Burkholderiales bacterium]|nr:NADH-quinone oxidoreductase subunit C [Burkholderiales bacterium]
MATLNWPHSALSRDEWERAAARLQRGELGLLGLWAEPRCAYMAVIEHDTNACSLLSVACEEDRFPSVGRLHPPAIRPERAIRDLVGLEPEGLPDTRPWLRHRGAYPFLPASGESLHQIPVGPVHAGIIEPGHFRFTANGETVVRLEERLGYTHKGVDALIAGAAIERAAVLAGRISGDSTVAFALAFARAVEAALGIEIPPRAVWLRGLLAELERLANHFGDIGAICNDAALAILHAQFGLLRERVLRTSSACFGHRLMMDRVVPGGLRCDLPEDGAPRVHELVAQARKAFPDLVEVYENTASLKDRTVGTGVLSPALARQFAAGGFVGRASGRKFDARRTPGYAPYDALRFEVPVVQAGDVNARVWIRIREVEESLALLEQILAGLPPGPVYSAIPEGVASGVREGVALVEGFRGDILAWLRIDAAGRVERCHLRDPSWFQWPLLEAAIEGNIVADFPLCNKSFNCSYSGHDL